MQTIEQLRRKLQNAETLLSVVRTMKNLAMVNVRQYERATTSLVEYSRTVDMGLHIVLSAQESKSVTTRPVAPKRVGAVVFGSDQGLCGQFNERIIDYAVEQLAHLGEAVEATAVIAVGARCALLLESAYRPAQIHLSTPSGISSVTSFVQRLLAHIEKWRLHQRVDQILLFHHAPLRGTAYFPQQVQLWPLDLAWLHSLETSRWPSRVLPTFTMAWDRLFADLIREHLFVALHRVTAESMAAENISRILSMQNAERNIEERLDELHTRYQRQRQSTITADLLDVIAGYEAVTHNVL